MKINCGLEQRNPATKRKRFISKNGFVIVDARGYDSNSRAFARKIRAEINAKYPGWFIQGYVLAPTRKYPKGGAR